MSCFSPPGLAAELYAREVGWKQSENNQTVLQPGERQGSGGEGEGGKDASVMEATEK